MRMTTRGTLRRTLPFLILVSLAAGGASRCPAQSDQSPREQLQQYVTQLQANPSDDALRTKIIQLALTLQPPPAAPPEADELAGRAKYIFEHANSNDDLLKAADAFGKVSLVVPWAPDYYFDAAVAYEKANDPANALKNYKWSLLAGPDSQDAKSIREKIGALSYVLEQQQAAAASQRQQQEAQQRQYEEQQREQAQLQNMWTGSWRGTTADAHYWFEIQGDEIFEKMCWDRPYHLPGQDAQHGWSYPGDVSNQGRGHVQGSTAHLNEEADGFYPLALEELKVDSSGNSIEVSYPNAPRRSGFMLWRVNNPASISPKCPQ